MYISDKFDDVVQLNVSFFVQCCSGEEPPSVDGVRGWCCHGHQQIPQLPTAELPPDPGQTTVPAQEGWYLLLWTLTPGRIMPGVISEVLFCGSWCNDECLVVFFETIRSLHDNLFWHFCTSICEQVLMFGVQDCQKGKYADYIYLASSCISWSASPPLPGVQAVRATGVFADGVAGQPRLSIPRFVTTSLTTALSVGEVKSQLHTTIT